MLEPTQQFAIALRRVRRAAGLSQERLAELSGLHRTAISLLERGARDPQVSTIVRLAGCLGVPPGTFLDHVEGEPVDIAAAPGSRANLRRERSGLADRELRARDQLTANLRRHRRRSGLSQETLGARCGLHRAEISRFERGEREPRLSTLVRLAECLGVRPSTLLERIS